MTNSGINSAIEYFLMQKNIFLVSEQETTVHRRPVLNADLPPPCNILWDYCHFLEDPLFQDWCYSTAQVSIQLLQQETGGYFICLCDNVAALEFTKE